MFYSRSSIDKHLICVKCSQRFKTPKVLPCGELICEDCIKNVSMENCTHCGLIHEIPAEGLPTQRIFQELLNIKPYASKDYNKVLIKELEDTFNELNRSIERTKNKIDNYENEIKCHYASINHDTEQRINEAIRELINLKNKSQEKYEQEKQSSLKNIRGFMQKFIEESDGKFLEWNKLLRDSLVITTDRIKEATLSVAEFLCTIATYDKNIDDLLVKVPTEDQEVLMKIKDITSKYHNADYLTTESDDEDVI